MIECLKCGASMINAKGEVRLICITCAARGSREELLVLQREFLPAVMATNYPLFQLAQRAGRNEWHIEFMGPFHGQALCGVVFENPKTKKGRSEWRTRAREYSNLEAEPNLCQQCRATLAEEAAAVIRKAAGAA